MSDFSSQIYGDLERVSNFKSKKNVPEIPFNSGLSFGIKDDNLPHKPLEKTQDGWLEHPHVSMGKYESSFMVHFFVCYGYVRFPGWGKICPSKV